MDKKLSSAPEKKDIFHEKENGFHVKKETLKTEVETDVSLDENRVDIEVQHTKELLSHLDTKNGIPLELLEGIDIDDPEVRLFLKNECGIDLDRLESIN